MALSWQARKLRNRFIKGGGDVHSLCTWPFNGEQALRARVLTTAIHHLLVLLLTEHALLCRRRGGMFPRDLSSFLPIPGAGTRRPCSAARPGLHVRLTHDSLDTSSTCTQGTALEVNSTLCRYRRINRKEEIWPQHDGAWTSARPPQLAQKGQEEISALGTQGH